MEGIDIRDLHKVQENRDLNKIQFNKSVLTKIYHKLRYNTARGETSCFYVIPEFTFGVPLYRSDQCASYVIQDLISRGFFTYYMNPNLLYISWDKKYTKSTKPPEKRQNLIQKISEKKSNIKSISDYNPSGKFICDQNNIL